MRTARGPVPTKMARRYCKMFHCVNELNLDGSRRSMPRRTSTNATKVNEFTMFTVGTLRRAGAESKLGDPRSAPGNNHDVTAKAWLNGYHSCLRAGSQGVCPIGYGSGIANIFAHPNVGFSWQELSQIVTTTRVAPTLNGLRESSITTATRCTRRVAAARAEICAQLCRRFCSIRKLVVM